MNLDLSAGGVNFLYFRKKRKEVSPGLGRQSTQRSTSTPSLGKIRTLLTTHESLQMSALFQVSFFLLIF